ncbi:MAG: hypothetical protein WC856_02560 [Methylococcaceae bacterium]|jgi:hypothetical protein
MSTLKAGLLEAGARIIFVGKWQLWADAKAFCHAAFDDDNLSNGDKKAKVKAQLGIIFKDASSLLLNYVIEFAVIFLVSKYPPLASIIASAKSK